MKIEIRSVKLFHDDDGLRPFRKLAFAEVTLPEISMQIRDVTLTWSEAEGYIAVAPFAETRSKARAVTWHHQSDFGKALAQAIVKAWRGIGGVNPSEPLPVKQQPIERRVFPASFTVHDEASDAEAVEGLARTLSVEQEEVRRVLS
ncbi:hypothetical protein ACS4RR_016980 [Rhizobium sp. Z1P35]|jgi:hypothetical protein|uniref:Uncharacterized protein n=1 Tax=Rhizobium leguminosarum TaxID=384 RepID=A0A4Q8XZR5_RHILE|nr:hypothetical protein [Rhizobium leguminosarum]TAX72541.1 hypothetical protein ELI03_12690 [Rhizobium leguminosarum]